MDINCTGTPTTKQPRVPDKGPNIAAVLLSARTASYKYMFAVVIPGPRHATPGLVFSLGTAKKPGQTDRQRKKTSREKKEGACTLARPVSTLLALCVILHWSFPTTANQPVCR